MPNPYVQVALTYPRHIGASGIWGFVTAAMMLIAFVFLGTMIARSDEHHNGMLWLIIVMSSLGLWQTIVAHAREQFADSRSHLMPNFRDAHFAAFAALALMVVLLVPVTFTWLVGLRSIVPVAVSVFLCGATLPQPRWLKTVLSASGWGVFLLFIAIANYWPYWPQQLFSGELISSGQLECPALIVLVLGAAMAVSGGRWLADERGYAGLSPDDRARTDTEQTIDRAARD